jgi:ABC-type Co2+ transport system permease subunit
VHALIGIGEAAITATVVSTVLAVRSDLVGAWNTRGAQ